MACAHQFQGYCFRLTHLLPTSLLPLQRFCRYEGDVILFEAVQTNMDIPYGDCFTVNTRWEVRPLDPADPSDASGVDSVDGSSSAGGSAQAGGCNVVVLAGAAAGAAAQPKRLRLEVYLRVAFSRVCLFKKVWGGCGEWEVGVVFLRARSFKTTSSVWTGGGM